MKEMDDGTVYLVGVTDQMLSIGLAPGPTASTLNVVNSNKPRGSKEIPVARFSRKHLMPGRCDVHMIRLDTRIDNPEQ